jgi:hypothetical protein
LSPDELRAVATGCVSPAPSATGGSRYPGELTAITLKDGAVAYVRPVSGAPRIVSAKRPGLIVEYDQFASGLPHRIVLRGEAKAGEGSELTLTLSQIELNTALGPQAFAMDVPPDAKPITLDELRASGPFGRSAK